MKKAYLKLLLILAIVIVIGMVAVGCNRLDRSGGYDHLVTFNYNYGNMDANCPDQFVGVKDGSLLLLQPGEHTKLPEHEVEGLYLEGWYLPKVDEDGNPIKNEENIVLLDRKWNFEEDVVTEDITLYANLVKRIKLEYVDRATGEVLSSIVETPGAVRPEPQIAPKKDGYTFTGKYYANETGDELFSWPHTFGETDEKVYVEFIEGKWNIVRTASELKNALRNNKNVYLANDIDYADAQWTTYDYAGEFNGNGHKVSNISVIAEQEKGFDTYSALFNMLKATANIHDVEFENIVMTYQMRMDIAGIKIALFSAEIEAGAKLTNVKVGGELRYEDRSGSLTISDWATNSIDQIDIVNCEYNVTKINSSSN